ncbi:MAG: helix-turn-helix domain-containing protein [Caenispirillum bisanense]|nr:helix-turn-helix domain-containing protein [Caenispirillum bisanense]MCA1971257.1 helix-turn-helix domain-containing protein [Caenispirillum sp.]
MKDEATHCEVRTPSACLPPTFRKGLLRRPEASEYLLKVWGLSYTPNTLAKMASQGTGPPTIRGAMRTPFYPRTELDRWAAERIGLAA